MPSLIPESHACESHARVSHPLPHLGRAAAVARESRGRAGEHDGGGRVAPLVVGSEGRERHRYRRREQRRRRARRDGANKLGVARARGLRVHNVERVGELGGRERRDVDLEQIGEGVERVDDRYASC